MRSAIWSLQWNHRSQCMSSLVFGPMAYKNTIDYCKEKGLVVIGDIKRGDIGSTSAAYAVGHLGKVQVGSNTESQVLTKILRQSIHIWDLTVSTCLSMYVKKRTKGFCTRKNIQSVQRRVSGQNHWRTSALWVGWREGCPVGRITYGNEYSYVVL